MTTIDHNSVADVEEINLGIQVVLDANDKPFLLLTGPEPDLRWEAFSQAVADLIERLGVTQTICLYSAPMTVPHTRPMVISATRQLVRTYWSPYFKMDTRFEHSGFGIVAVGVFCSISRP